MRILISTLAVFALALGTLNAKEDAKTGKVCEKAKAACASACTKGEAVTFKVDGMTCGGCASKLSKNLASVEGVTVEKVCAKSDKAVVKYNADKVCSKSVMAAVEKSGFKVAGQEVTIPVSGMTCGGCSGKVTRALAALDGVSDSAVCHKSGKAVVTFDPSKTCSKTVAKTIEKTGFKTAAK